METSVPCRYIFTDITTIFGCQEVKGQITYEQGTWNR